MKKTITIISAIVMFVVSLSVAISANATDPSTWNYELSGTSYTYNGKEKTPIVTITDENGDIIPDTEYTVSYENNVNAGQATVNIYDTSDNLLKSLEYTIKQKSISSFDFQLMYTKTIYSGNAKTPGVTVFYNKEDNVRLSGDTDYTVSYSNNKKPGVAKVLITGKGNYKGKISTTFNIKPKTVTGIVTSNRTTNSIKLNWNKQSYIDGYKIYKYDSSKKKYVYLKKTANNYCTIDKLSNAKVNSYKVRAYVVDGKKTVYGDLSNVYKTCSKPEKVSLQSVIRKSNKSKMKVSWKRTPSSGYEIVYSKNKDLKNAKKVIVKDSSNISKTLSISKKGKYYAKVRAFRQYKYNDKTRTVYGGYSTVLSTEFSKLYASYTTSFVNNPSRTENLYMACKYINGTVIEPGETFSFNKVVGKRTEARGFKPGTVFTGSNSTALQIGGGVCQVASTMFNAALIGNLQITSRYQHSQRVSYVPLGRDAAIYWGSEDFKFTNNTKYPIKIVMKCDKKSRKLYCKYYISYDAQPKKVKLKVTRSGKTFTLKRYVSGKCNYTTKSTY